MSDKWTELEEAATCAAEAKKSGLKLVCDPQTILSLISAARGKQTLPDGCVAVCKLCGCRAKEEEIYGCQYKSRLGAFSHHPDCPIRQESKA